VKLVALLGELIRSEHRANERSPPIAAHKLVATAMTSPAFIPCAPLPLVQLFRSPARSIPRRYPVRPRACAIPPPDAQQSEPLTPDPSSAPLRPPTPQYTLKSRLREEVDAPFRKVRQFVLAGSGASAAVGLLVSLLRIVAAVSGVRGVQPLGETTVNAGVDVAVIGLCAFLWRREQDAGERRLERMARGAVFAGLKVEDPVTGKAVRLSEFRGQFRVVVVAGPRARVEACVADAAAVRDGLVSCAVKVVPLVTDVGGERADGHAVGSGAGTWFARPKEVGLWRDWLRSEKAGSGRVDADEAADDNVYVIIVKMNGKIGSKSIGAPRWASLVDQVALLPTKDQYTGGGGRS
jgi:Low psii accumulation1 / Rep27